MTTPVFAHMRRRVVALLWPGMVCLLLCVVSTTAAQALLSLSPSSLPADTINVAYNQTITASGGTGSHTITISNVSGALPGVIISGSGTSGIAITGTPTATRTETFTATVTDSVGATASINYSLTVNPAPSLSPSSLPADTINVAYNQTITASGGTGAHTITISNVQNALPGVNLSGSGTSSIGITGTPTATGTETFTATVTDSVGATASINYSLTVNPSLSLSPSSLPADTINVPYNQTITASGGTGSHTITISNVQNALPGVNLSGSGTSGISITGTPTATGTETFTATVTDSVGATASVNYSLTVNTSLPIVTSVSPNGGPPAGVTSVTITGINFTGATAVKFGATAAASFSVTSATSITATSPAGAIGAVDVTVTTSQGTSTASAADKFTYAAPRMTQQGHKLIGAGYAGQEPTEGDSVALSADGNTLAFGGHTDNGVVGGGIGAVWVFTRSGSIWTQQAKLVGTGYSVQPDEGWTIALSADGNTLLVGTGNYQGGGAWVFARNGSTWTQQGSALAPSDASGATPAFGTAVALSSDGNTAVVGGPGDNDAAGAAWVFTRSGSTWAQQGSKLVASDESGNGGFGSSVALNGTSTTAIIGGWNDNSATGAAWIFNQSGGVWSQQGGKLIGSDATGAAQQGYAVALSTDGNTALVGGRADSSSTGAAWLFTRSGGVWSQAGAKLVGTGAVGAAIQGYAVALSGDGRTAAIGGPTDNANAGAVWLFTQNNGTWSQKGSKLVGAGNNGVAGQGTSVALSRNGKTLAEGGPADNGYVGAVWIFTTAAIADSHDFNGDGTSDILWRDTAGDTTIWLMNGGSVAQGTGLGNIPTAWSVVGVRDFDGDGDADILWRDTSGDTTIWLMNGASIAQGISLGNIPTAWSVAGTGDFNGDGAGDILWRDTSGDATIWFGPFTGGHVTTALSLGTIPTVWTIVGTGDFNGDGTSDILWRDTGGDISIWELRSGVIMQGVGLGNLPVTWSVAGTGDFNGDDTSDILWRNTSGDVMIWLINNGALQQQSVLGNLPTTWNVAETGDFNGDGDSDILWIDTSGNVMIWFMNGIAVTSAVSFGNVGTAWSVQGSNAD